MLRICWSHSGLKCQLNRMAGFFNSEVNAVMLIYTALESGPIYTWFCHSDQDCAWLSYLLQDSTCQYSLWQYQSLYLKLFYFTFFLFLARTICKYMCRASVMHSLLTLIHIPEVQQSKLKSLLNEYVLNYFKHLFQPCSHGLCAPFLQWHLV